jgi:hypothetical protein
MIPCQLVLACTGTTPVTTLAEHCDVPMMYKRGILVNDQFRTNVRDVYAAGDVAAHKNPWTGGYETQAQWQAAVLQGRTVAAMMTGHHELAAKPLGVRWHATHLGELSMLTVGNPLSEIEGTTILTDSSKRRYCRMSIIDDRLVGYLSLAPAQPDSLAIKRIIDEGLSIRDIKKALLKGNFDARKYFSELRSRTVQEIVTSGKLPAVTVNPTQHPLPLVHSLSTMVHPGSPSVKVRLEGVMMPGMRQTHPTSVSVRPSIYDQPTIDERNEELRAVTEKLPAQAKKGVKSMLVPLPSRSVSRSLWSYSEKIPAVKRQQSSSQNSDTSAEVEKAGDDEHVERANFLL